MEHLSNWELLVIAILIVAILIIVIYGMIRADEKGYDRGYKEGQIDAIRGKIRYELKETGKGETAWTEIKPLYEIK